MKFASTCFAIVLCLTITAALSAPAFAADAPTAPADQPAKAAPAAGDADAPQGAELASTVTFVKGLVQVRQADDQPWKTATVGMKVAPGASFRTGPLSMVQFKVGSTQVVTLDRLGVVKVLDAIKSKGKVTTDLGMKYGRASLQVQAGGVEHDSTVHAPGATLSVRGSGGVILDDSFQSVVYCSEHEADATLRTHNGRIVHVHLPEPVITNDRDADPNITTKYADAFNPFHNGSTDTENELFANFPSGTYGFGGDSGAGPNAHSFQNMAATNAQISSTESLFGGVVDVGGTGLIRGQLIWTNTSDLDLHMLLPSSAGEVYYGNTTITFNGGNAIAKLDHDNLGGTIDASPNKRVENIVVYGTAVPAGSYTFFVNLFSSNGNATTPYTLILTGNGGSTTQTITGSLSSGSSPNEVVNSAGGSFTP